MEKAHGPLSAADEALLVELVARALADRAAGVAVDVDALCRAHPRLRAALAECLELERGLPALHDASTLSAAGGGALAGRYRLVEPLGSGAAGTVFRAFDERLRREVAVKLLHRGVLAGGDATARFLREAEVLAQLENRHVVRIHDRGQDGDGAPFLVTELLRGTGLGAVLAAAQQAMRQGASAAAFARADWLRALLPEAALATSYLRQVVRWTIELGEGLAAAHAHGVCHRDVKPSNAFVRSDGSAVLLDFGIAARAGDPGTTRADAVVGTPWYMPPEQARGRAEPRPTLDVYGLCATLYHLLTLRAPHDDGTGRLLPSAHADDPMPAARLHPGLAPDLQAILDRGLERDPARRYQAVGPLLADLCAFLEHRPVSVRPLGRPTRLWRRVRRHPARAVAWTASAAAFVALAVVRPLWNEVAATERANERAALLAQLPGDLCIEGWPDERPLVPLAERAGVLAELDRLLELDPDDLPTRVLRASERLDAGDRTAAAADFDAIARAADTPYLRAVAACYRRAGAARAGFLAVPLAELPAPQSRADFFVAGFHALRGRDPNRPEGMQEAYDLLSRAADWLPARDLRLLAMLGMPKPDATAILEEAAYLEGRYGRRTGRTRHAMCVAMLLQRDWQKAIEYGEDSLRLRPDRHGPNNNLGVAHLRLGHVDQALQYLQRAVERRPWFENSRQMLVQALRDAGRLDDSRAQAADIRSAWLREYELGQIELAAACAALRRGDAPARRAAALAAAAHYDASLPQAPERRRTLVAASAAAMRAFAADDDAATLGLFLQQVRQQPRNPTQLANLAALLGTAPPAPGVQAQLRLFLLDLAIDLAPGDPRLLDARQRLQRELGVR